MRSVALTTKTAVVFSLRLSDQTRSQLSRIRVGTSELQDMPLFPSFLINYSVKNMTDGMPHEMRDSEWKPDDENVPFDAGTSNRMSFFLLLK